MPEWAALDNVLHWAQNEAVMKAVMPAVPPEILEWRKRTGADRWDEMWDGVLHMGPTPNRQHQNFEFFLEEYLRRRWAPRKNARVYHNINLASPGGWPDNYRIPDLLLLTPERFSIDRNEYFEGAPNVVVEIHSPGDEAYEKLDFYAALGVPEVWIIHRDTKEPEIHLLKGDQYEKKGPEPNGWFHSDQTGIEMRVGAPGKLSIRLSGDESTREELPEDWQ